MKKKKKALHKSAMQPMNSPARDTQALVLPVTEILIGENIRSELGDLSELTESIKQNALLNPLLVSKTGEGYVLIDGHRRLAAMTSLGYKETPVRLVKSQPDLIKLISNLCREQLSGWETCKAIHDLLPIAESQSALADLIQKDKSYVSRCIAVVKSNPDPVARVKLSLRELFKSVSGELIRKASGPIPGGRSINSNALTYKERNEGKSFTLKLNVTQDTPKLDREAIILKLEELLLRLKS